MTLRVLEVADEHVDTFRDALRSHADERLSCDGVAGEIVFLNAKKFDADYFRFLDSFERKQIYPPGSKERVRLRKAALMPYLGMPLLHGGVRCQAGYLSVYIDLGSGGVIHFEIHTDT